MEAASSLTIEAEILCKRLSNAKLESLLDEVSYSPRILRKITGRKTLVCTIEEREVRLLLKESRQFLPLFLGWIDTSRVVCAGMEEDDAVIRRLRYRLLHSSKIETFCGFREVRVGSNGNRDIGEDLIVIGPCWIAEIDLGLARIELCEEESTQVHCSCAGDGLDGACALLSNSRRVCT